MCVHCGPFPSPPSPLAALPDPITNGGSKCIAVSLVITTATYPREISWAIKEALPALEVRPGVYTLNYHAYPNTLCLAPGIYTFVARDSFGDGWDGGSFNISGANVSWGQAGFLSF